MKLSTKVFCRRAAESGRAELPLGLDAPQRVLTAITAPPSAESGFTMVEIALSLAIIGFALVAIIGVLPIGLNVQRDNRQDTIINHDAAVWMDAIRNGAQGYNELTNHVMVITNYVWHYSWKPATHTYEPDSTVELTGSGGGSPEVNVFTPTSWSRNGILQNGNPQFLLTNGFHIIGVLSRPKIEWDGPANDPYTNFYLNYIVANVRAVSGSAVDKFPQNSPVILDSAFNYRLIPEIESYVPFDTNLIRAALSRILNPLDTNSPAINVGNFPPNTFDPSLPDIGTNEMAAYPQAYWDQVRINRKVLGVTSTNSHDLRLTFRWPLLPGVGGAGPGRQTFRLFTGGRLQKTNDPSDGVLNLPLYFFQPSTYVQTQ
jgi:type II secretory pathway pseudopilin PulG